MPQFRTRTGRLSAYSFACGYVEKKIRGSVETTLWHEGACYHVRQHDYMTHKRIFWDCFDTLAKARNRFNRVPGVLTTRAVVV